MACLRSTAVAEDEKTEYRLNGRGGTKRSDQFFDDVGGQVGHLASRKKTSYDPILLMWWMGGRIRRDKLRTIASLSSSILSQKDGNLLAVAQPG